jgi:hypothetical protein
LGKLTNGRVAAVLHIWSAEFLWLRVLQDGSYADNPTREYKGSTNELIEQWISASEAF